MPQTNLHTLTIDKVVTGGHGLARLASGLVVMVPFVLPGERVVVRVGKEHKGFAEAALLEVLEPSPQRVDPPCPRFQACGGCLLQHGDYPAQLAIKGAILQDLLARQGQWATEEIASFYESILPSPSPWHYRQRIRLQVDDRGRLGFFATRSHDVIEIAACPLAKDELNQVLADLRPLPAFRTLCRHAEALELLLNPEAGQVVVIVHLSRKPRAADQQAAAAVASSIALVQSVWLAGVGFAMDGPHGAQGEEGQGADRIAFTLPAELGGRPLLLELQAGGFCQVNLAQNEGLVRQLLAWAQVGADDAVLDLYCGMGNFSLPMALTARQVVGTDLQRSSIRCAQANALANQLDNCRFLRTVAVAAIRQLRKAQERFDLILLDPPRSGCREIIPLLPNLGADRLIYISCDPATLVRDLRQLHGAGFRVRRIRGVDMFPQTAHLETIALMTRA
jgi:23S rRNA (uracil1939-C5)-methyltransferase